MSTELPAGFVEEADLTKPLEHQLADWVISFEVLEHIPKHLEMRFIENLVGMNRNGARDKTDYLTCSLPSGRQVDRQVEPIHRPTDQ